MSHKEEPPKITQEMITSMFDAVYNNDVETLAEILGAYSKTDIQESSFTTELLITACYQGKASAAKYLLEAGVHPDIEGDYGNTPREAARECGAHEILALFDNHHLHLTKTHRDIQAMRPLVLSRAHRRNMAVNKRK